jgi:hypothetical protein
MHGNYNIPAPAMGWAGCQMYTSLEKYFGDEAFAQVL